MLSEMVLQAVLFKRNLILNKQLNLTAVIAAIQTQSQMKNQSQFQKLMLLNQLKLLLRNQSQFQRLMLSQLNQSKLLFNKPSQHQPLSKLLQLSQSMLLQLHQQSKPFHKLKTRKKVIPQALTLILIENLKHIHVKIFKIKNHFTINQTYFLIHQYFYFKIRTKKN